MSRTKKIAILAIIAMVLTMLPVQLFAATTAAESTRLFGNSRVETALAVCDAGWSAADTVVVAPADQANLVDALAAAPLAGQENAPILLTFKDSLDAAVKAKISALGAKKVYVVGAISDSVKDEIAGISGVTVEVLKGSSRWDTAKAINAKLTSPAGCFVVGYAALADALSVSSYAAANKYAIILADVNGNIPAGQSALGSKTYLIGGSTLVADIPGATRIAGADRFETNKKVLETLGFDYNKVYVANGFNNHLVDSLVAAPLAAKAKAPIVLADNSGVAAASVVNAKLTAASQIVALGGSSVVSDSVRDTVKYNTPATFAVEDIVPVGLNAFKVTFNQEVDEDTAEIVSNYKVDGSSLTVGTDSAVLQPDKKTVLVMMSPAAGTLNKFNQNKEVIIEVRGNVVYNKDKDSSAASKSKTVKFSDLEIPQLKSVTAIGNKKLVVEFTEPVNANGVVGAGGQCINWKIDGQELSSLGIDATNSVAKDATSNAGGRIPFAYKYELYFSTALSAGTHTLTVKDGAATAAGYLNDGADFTFEEASKEFTVESKTDAPKVEGVEVVNNEVRITFDRPMYKDPAAPNTGTGSALNVSYYNVNDKGTGATTATSPSVESNPEFKSNTGDKVVKFNVDSGVIQKGVNVVEISKDVKDAWGNKLSSDDNVRVSFTYSPDTTKPTVLSVACVSDTKVRIHFSEDIDKTYAQNVANYEIKKSDGTEIFGKNAGGTATTVPANTDSDTVELIMPAGTKVDGSGYTLKIKDLRDTAIDANVIDTYTTTFDGYDDFGPNLDEVIPHATDSTKAVAFFSEALDSGTVVFDNFGYKDGEGKLRDLPSGTTVSIDGTGKIVTVDFPAAYTVKVGTAAGAGDTNDKYEVIGIRASNVKDKSGNLIQGVAQTVDILATTPSPAKVPSFVADSFNLYDDGDDIKAEFEMNQEITSLTIADFKVGIQGGSFTAATSSMAPASGYTVGKKVYLKFTGNNADSIRGYGKNATLFSAAAPTSTNTAGVAIGAFPTAGYQVYDDQVKPKIAEAGGAVIITSDNGSGAAGAIPKDHAVVKIQFTEDIDPNIVGLYEDDFIFSAGGKGLSVSRVMTKASGGSFTSDVVVFDLGPCSDVPGGQINVKAVEDKINIRDVKDRGPEDYNTYVPKQDDKDGYNVADAVNPVVVSVTFSDGATANAGVLDSDDTITIVYSEAVDLTGIYAGLTAGNTITDTFANLSSNFGTFATPFAAGTATTDNATSTATLSADGKTLVITAAGLTSDGSETNPAGAFTPAAATTDAAANGIDTTVKVTAGGSF